MFPRTGEWFMAHGDTNPMDVAQVLKYQKHGEHKKFGIIALQQQIINGRQLRDYERDLRVHG